MVAELHHASKGTQHMTHTIGRYERRKRNAAKRKAKALKLAKFEREIEYRLSKRQVTRLTDYRFDRAFD
jgi:hypothetical protein